MVRPLRVVLVGPTHPYSGGIATHTTSFAHRLRAAGHRVVVMSWKAQYPRFLRSGATHVPEDAPEVDPFPGALARLAWYDPFTWLRAGWAMRSADLVVVTGVTPYHAVPYLAMRLVAGRRPTTVVLAHNVLPHEPGALDVALVRALYRGYGAVLVHSEEQAAIARRIAGPDVAVSVARLPLADLRFTPVQPTTGPGGAAGADPGGAAGADPAVAAPDAADRPVTVGFFGMVRHYKGVDLLIEAAARVPGVRVVVRGEFWQSREEYQAQVDRLGVGDRVVLDDGYVPMADLPTVLAGFDVLALPYRTGSSTINVALAFRSGLPVLATDAGTMALDVRDGVDGMIVPAGDVDALAGALERLTEPGVLEALRASVDTAGADTAWAAYVATAVAFRDGVDRD